MNVNKTQILALLAVFAVVAQGAVAAAALGVNTQASEYPETKFVEDELTVETHDRSSMGWLQYEGDNGKIQTIDANVNGTTSGAKVSYRADRIAAKAFGEYPRKSDEENNSATWLDTTDWSTSVSDTGTADGDPASSLTVSDTDGKTGAEVDSITYEATDVYSGDTATATYSNHSITSDVEKRYLQLVLNVENLEGVVEVQIRDGGGDYVAPEINGSADYTAADVITNQTASGVIYQRQLGQFAVQGSGDGTLDAIEEVRIHTMDGNATVAVTALNVQKKSEYDFGSERVADGDGGYTDETVRNHPEGGPIEMADIATLGSEFSDATLHKLSYLDVEYRMQDDPAAATFEFEDAGDTYPGFHSIFNVEFRKAIPSAYDLTHGTLTLETNQSFLSERYITVRYAEGVGDTETENINDSDWIDLSGSLGDKDTTIVADDTVSSDTEYVLQLEVKLTESQDENLQPVQESGGGGFWGSSGGSPFHSLYNWVVGGFVGLLTMLGLAKRGS